jgi:nucleoside-diphosphate-sugar epimerase
VYIFDDITDDIYGHEKALEAEEPYPQRTTELGVVDTGLALGVSTLVIMSPMIYGNGTGLFNKKSAQTFLYRAALNRKKPAVVGEGRNIVGHVHIADLADLYKLILLEILDRDGQHLPSGKKGIIFSAHGENTMIREAELIAAAGHGLGVLPEKSVEHLSPEAAAREFLPSSGYFTKEQIEAEGPRIIERVLAPNARTVPSVAHKLGWKPSKGEDAWEQAVKDNVKSEAAVLGLL